MYNYEINLSVYQGPMDVLLLLINKHKIDIYDIPICKLTDEFLNYINEHDFALDVATEFLKMSSTLLEIKSKVLLFHKFETEEEEDDPREELVNQLLEYKKLKLVAEELKNLDNICSKIYFKEPEDLSEYNIKSMNPLRLSIAFDKLLSKRLQEHDVNIEPIKREDYPLERAIDNLKLKIKQKNRFSLTEVLGENFSISKLITFFLAILELMRKKMLYAIQENPYGEIFIEGIDK